MRRKFSFEVYPEPFYKHLVVVWLDHYQDEFECVDP